MPLYCEKKLLARRSAPKRQSCPCLDDARGVPEIHEADPCNITAFVTLRYQPRNRHKYLVGGLIALPPRFLCRWTQPQSVKVLPTSPSDSVPHPLSLPSQLMC